MVWASGELRVSRQRNSSTASTVNCSPNELLTNTLHVLWSDENTCGGFFFFFFVLPFLTMYVCPQAHWWCLVIQVACGPTTPSPSSGVSTRCGSGCSRSWTYTRSMPPAFPSKTLTWTAISSAAWVTRTSSVLLAAWDPSSSRASQSSSGAVRFRVWLRGAKKEMISLNKGKAGKSRLSRECYWEGTTVLYNMTKAYLKSALSIKK